MIIFYGMAQVMYLLLVAPQTTVILCSEQVQVMQFYFQISSTCQY